MKNTLIGLLLAFAASFAFAAGENDGHLGDYEAKHRIDQPVMRNDSHTNSYLNRHNSRLSRIRKHESKHYDIVFFGDSITHNWERDREKRAKYGQEVWADEFSGMEVLNCGFGGDRVETCHWRAVNGELSGYEADNFCILIGTNNRQNSSEEISGGVKALVKAIEERHPESRIVLMTILPRCDINPPKVTEEVIARVRGANPLIEQWAAEDSRITLLNLDPFFTNDDGSVKTELFNDGIHPNPAGYRIWARELKKVMKKRENPPVPKTMADALAQYLESGELPGAISVLIKPGATDVSVMGFADVANNVPMSLDAPFMQCSQTKGFCGVTVAMLVEEGKLSLDDPVAKYLPEFADRPGITVRMVMNHTAGFPFETPTKDRLGWHHASIADTVREAATNQFLFAPGRKVKYSNTGIDVGAAVVEKVSGQPWEVFLKERVLDPLGMKDTTFWPTDDMIARRIRMYRPVANEPAQEVQDDGHWMKPPWNGPQVFASAGAGLWTTANDQLKFYKMLMNLGIGENGVRILKEETVKGLLATSTRPDGMEGYSLGLNVQKDGWFGHGGAWNTNTMVNWEKKELAMWVVQNIRGPRPWEKVRDSFKDAFFAESLESSDAYTGRLK